VVIDGNEDDPNPPNNEDEETPDPNPLADLAIVKSISNSTPNVGSNVTFTLLATNNGPSDATGVAVNEPLLAGYTFVSATPSVGAYNQGTGIWTIGSLANQASATLNIVVTVNPSGPYTNAVVIDGNEDDPNLPNNEDEETPTPVLDLDTDDDTIPDTIEISNVCPSRGGDTDGDGVPDHLDLDSDGDGIFDIVEIGNADLDLNLDGRVDTTQGLNGLGDVVETSPDSGMINYVIPDSDADGRPNYLDLDSDNDSISDLLESGSGSVVDTINRGLAQGVVNTDGIVPGTGAVLPVDTDGTGGDDYIDVDSDNDGVFDIVDNGWGNLDPNMDGRIDNTSSPDDCDGIADVLDPQDPVYGWFPPHGCPAWNFANEDDTDGDVFPVDQEYAFGGDPQLGNHLVVGTTRRMGMTIAKNGTVGVEGGAPGGVDISYIRPKGRYDALVALYVSDDPRVSNKWTPVSALPVITDNGDNTETLKWSNIHDIDGNALVTPNRGFARLKVQTPCNPAGSWTLVQGWCRQNIVGKYQTYGLNFSSMPAFTGVINSTTTSVVFSTSSGKGQNLSTYLTVGGQFYLELTDGSSEGHRFEIASGALDSFVLNLASVHNTTHVLPADLAGSHFVVRRHDTLGGVYANAEWNRSSSPNSADQVLFYNGSGYDTYYNLSVTTWAKQGSGFTNRGGLVIAPGTGMMVVHSNPADTNELLEVGDLRYNDFRRPLRQGSNGLNFMDLGHPFSQSPASLNMIESNGFVRASSPNAATQIQNWNGDSTPNTQGWTTNFLLTATGWRTQGNTILNTSNDLLFRECRSNFVLVRQDNLAWTHLLPWLPAPWVQP
jgi:uncharacterized repeat protein (TIGR01451 family)